MRNFERESCEETSDRDELAQSCPARYMRGYSCVDHIQLQLISSRERHQVVPQKNKK